MKRYASGHDATTLKEMNSNSLSSKVRLPAFVGPNQPSVRYTDLSPLPPVIWTPVVPSLPVVMSLLPEIDCNLPDACCCIHRLHSNLPRSCGGGSSGVRSWRLTTKGWAMSPRSFLHPRCGSRETSGEAVNGIPLLFRCGILPAWR